MKPETEVAIAATIGAIFLAFGLVVLHACGMIEPIEPRDPKRFEELVGRDLSKKPDDVSILDYSRGRD